MSDLTQDPIAVCVNALRELMIESKDNIQLLESIHDGVTAQLEAVKQYMTAKIFEARAKANLTTTKLQALERIVIQSWDVVGSSQKHTPPSKGLSKTLAVSQSHIPLCASPSMVQLHTAEGNALENPLINIHKIARAKFVQNGETRFFMFGGTKTLNVGRQGKEVDVQIAGAGVDSPHFRLSQDIDAPFRGLKLICLSSSGMTVGGISIPKGRGIRKLNHGVIIKFGSVELRYEFVAPIEALTQRYTVGKQVGTGKTGSVYLVKNKHTAKESVAKIPLDWVPATLESFQREVAILKLMQGKNNFAQMEESISGDGRTYIILHHYLRGTVHSFIELYGPVYETVAKQWVSELVLGLKALRDERIVHHDLKPENLLVDDFGHLIIADFGSARIGDIFTTKEGTAEYMACEILSGLPHTARSDISSVGSVAFFILTGLPPFLGASNEQELLTMVKSGDVKWNLLKNRHCNAKSWIEGVLNPNPDLRTTLESIMDHDWFRFDAAFEGTSSTGMLYNTDLHECSVLSNSLTVLTDFRKGTRHMKSDGMDKALLTQKWTQAHQEYFGTKVNNKVTSVLRLTPTTLKLVAQLCETAPCKAFVRNLEHHQSLPYFTIVT